MTSSYFQGKSYFENGGTQNCLVFQPMYGYLKKTGNADRVPLWKSNGLGNELIKHPSKSDNSLALTLSYIGNKTRVTFDGGCLKQNKIIFTHGKQ